MAGNSLVANCGSRLMYCLRMDHPCLARPKEFRYCRSLFSRGRDETVGFRLDEGLEIDRTHGEMIKITPKAPS